MRTSRRIPGPEGGRGRTTRAARLALALALAFALAGCAKKAPPSGGPPDLEPPRVLETTPDSGRAGVARDARLSITFSEGMEPQVTGQSVALAPNVKIRQLRWSARTLTVTLAESLRADQTYTLFVSRTARDRHGNAMTVGATVPFTTAAAYPAGRISGAIEARGFDAAGTSLWVYDAARAPDSTARDFQAIGLADEHGRFSIPGLAVPGRYRLWSFADLNGNRSFEPDRDVLVPADTVIALSAERPAADSLSLRVVNPRAGARLVGAVVDSLGDSLGVLRVVALSSRDSTRRVVADAGENGAFELSLDAGPWKLVAFRDLDRNRQWKPAVEPASAPLALDVEPAAEVKDLVLVLARPPAVPSGP